MNEDLIRKWSYTGLLSKVKQEHLDEVVTRLEAAALKSLRTKISTIEQEIIAIKEEGLFGT